MNDTIAIIVAVFGMAAAFGWMCCAKRPSSTPRIGVDWLPSRSFWVIHPARRGGKTARIKQRIDEILKERGS